MFFCQNQPCRYFTKKYVHILKSQENNYVEQTRKLARTFSFKLRNDDEDKVDELMKYFDISSQESHLLKLKSVMEKFNNALEMIFLNVKIRK